MTNTNGPVLRIFLGERDEAGICEMQDFLKLLCGLLIGKPEQTCSSTQFISKLISFAVYISLVVTRRF